MSVTVHPPSLFSSRTSTVMLIAALHAIAIYAVATGLMHPVSSQNPPPVHASFEPEPHVDLPPPVLPPPNLTPQRVEVVEPVLRLDAPVDDGPSASVIPGPERLPPASVPEVRRVPGGPAKGFPNTEDYYPSVSRRLAEIGVTSIRACVDANGRLVAQPSIAQSSGSARLDEAALRLAQAGSGHYRPTTEDGRPVSACFPFRVRFELRE